LYYCSSAETVAAEVIETAVVAALAECPEQNDEEDAYVLVLWDVHLRG
jgi:hypothetical protein